MRNEHKRNLVVCIWVLIASSIASAQNWVPINWPKLGCVSLSCSADGTTLAVASEWEPLCTSTNSGVSWISNAAPAYGWWSVATSADGNGMAASGVNNAGGGVVYLSTNRGVSWFSSSFPTNATPAAMAASANVTRLVVVGSSGSPIYVSTNSGATWATNSQSSDNYQAISCSSDGMTMVAAGWNGGVHISTNGGADWTLRGVADSLAASACSSDGTRMVVAQRSSSLFLSSDSGATWKQTTIPGTSWISVSMSSDGKQIAAFSDFGSTLYRSTNFGATWFTNTPPNSNPSIVLQIPTLAFSADGNRLFAPAGRDWIYVADTAASPSLVIASTDTNVQLSWLVPSTKFELEQNSNLDSGGWSTVANVPSLNFTNLHYQVDLPARSGNNFFRLKRMP